MESSMEKGNNIKSTKARTYVKRMMAINKIINVITSDINIDGVVFAISHEIAKLINCGKLSICIKNRYFDKLNLFIPDENNPQKIISKQIYLSATNGPGRVFITRQILIITDVCKDNDARMEYEQVLSSKIRSAVIFPLISKGKLIGTMNIGSSMPQFYKKNDIKIVKKIINQIAVAIENASLYTEVKQLTQQLQKTVSERNAEIEKKYYQLSLLNKVGHAMQGTLELDRVLHLILTCVTAGGAIGFNRAILLLRRDNDYLQGVMGVGPASGEEAGRIWERLSRENWKIDDFFSHFDTYPTKQSSMNDIAKTIKIPLKNKSDFVVMSVMEKRSFLISGGLTDARVHPAIKQKLMSNEFVIVPLLSHDKVLGIIIADNLFSGRHIDKDSMQLLNMFANQAGLAVERADAYEKLTRKIKEAHNAYNALKKTQNKLVRSERLATIGKMAAHVAHEIRNPLTTIGGFAHTMLKYPQDKEKVEKNAKIIYEEVYRLERILQNVLDFTKPGSPVFQLGYINNVINETIELLEDEINETSTNLKISFHQELPRILFDAEQIKQAFINILKNAVDSIKKSIKFNPRKTNDNIIEVKTSIKKDYIVIAVCDTGIGMSQFVIEHLFNPFYTTKQGGSGLGLAITHKIIEEHGGYIEVESNVGSGSVFFIYLPLKTEQIV
ncbi:GAF domain-containing protein [bacterium]|nr:GAF domain-containing protein [bacterium]